MARVVTFDEFRDLPDGTIFSLTDGHKVTDLYRRGPVMHCREVFAWRFTATSLLPEFERREPGETGPLIDRKLVRGQVREFSASEFSRYVVYDVEDLLHLRREARPGSGQNLTPADRQRVDEITADVVRLLRRLAEIEPARFGEKPQ